LVGLCASAAFAQTAPMATEFQVNTFTTRGQYNGGVAMDRAGNFVITWSSKNQDGDQYGVLARLYDRAGASKAGPFIVNTYSTGEQSFPAVAMDPSGRFVITWGSPQDPGYGVIGQRFGASAARAGGEFPVNTYTPGGQHFSSVAADPGGNFVVVWQGDDGSQGGIFGQRFDNAGNRVGAEFQVNTYTEYFQDFPKVAVDGTGNFVVVWRGAGAGTFGGIFARRFDSSGTPQGDQIQVNTVTAFSGGLSAVAMDRDGGYLIVWSGYTAGGTSFPNGSDIVGKRFDKTGAAVGDEFLINQFTNGEENTPAVAMDGSGNFTVAWQSPHDGSELGTFARRYDRLGTAVSDEFQVNSYTTGAQGTPHVAATDTGKFVVAWDSYGQDGYGPGVFGRRSALSAAESFRADAHAASNGTSNLNGLLEPGETVLVEPAWSNSGASDLTFTGSSPDFSGPGGATYTLNDNLGDYGTIAAGASANCHDATTDCYEVAVSNPATRPVTHWDALLQENLSAGLPKTWTLHVGKSFTDVPVTQPFYKKIEALLHNGITAGCTPTTYCPGQTVSRAQMAIFVAKGIAGSGAAIPSSGKVSANAYSCKLGGVSLFTDVSPTDIFCKQVHYIAAQNVTLGCSATEYCPGLTVTRLQMAAFVAKAVVAPAGGPGVPVTYGPDPVTGLSYSCEAGTPNVHFTDVPATDAFCKHVHYLWAKGIIAGCSATTYCPADPVTRDAMAKFLGNAFNLQLYGP
jgi:hypothetical protein